MHVLSDIEISDKVNQTVLDEKKLKTLLPKMKKALIPAFIIPNYGDHAYLKVRFDSQTMSNLEKLGIRKIQEPATRMMIIANLWYQMIDEKMQSQAMLDMLLQTFPQEQDESVIHLMLQQTTDLVSDYLPLASQNQTKETVF